MKLLALTCIFLVIARCIGWNHLRKQPEQLFAHWIAELVMDEAMLWLAAAEMN